MAIERFIGETATLGVRTSRRDSKSRVNDTDPIRFAVSGLIDGNRDVILYVYGQSIEVDLTKAQARTLADLLHRATDI